MSEKLELHDVGVVVLRLHKPRPSTCLGWLARHPDGP
jgi:hypothetical protein